MSAHASLPMLECLLSRAGAAELCHIDGGKVSSGHFTDAYLMQQAAELLGASGDLYMTFNRPGPHIRPANIMGAPRLADADMTCHAFLMFDIDPVRPKGAPSTQQQADHARSLANDLYLFLRANLWPEPIKCFSGNGWHMLYACHLPADAGTKVMLRDLYRGLGDAFSNAFALFDKTTRNPARLTRCYGSVNRKGSAGRRSRCWMPPELHEVGYEAVSELAWTLRPPTPAPKPVSRPPVGKLFDWRQLDIVNWMRAAGLYRSDLGDGNHGIVCPWSAEHTGDSPPDHSDTVVMVAGASSRGYPLFFCHHSHCEGRWLRDLLACVDGAERHVGGAV